MNHTDVLAGKPAVRARTIVRGGEELRRYRRPTERWATTLGGAVIALATGIPLVSYLVAHTSRLEKAPLVIALLLLLYAVIFVAYFLVSARVGVEVARTGITSVSLTRRVFVEWSHIARFVVDRYTPLSVCVMAEGPDGARVPLNALAAWTFWSSSLQPYCDALNTERQERRDNVGPA